MTKLADDLDYVGFGEQERIYKAATGDKHWYLGFERRFAEWCEQNKHGALVAPFVSTGRKDQP